MFPSNETIIARQTFGSEESERKTHNIGKWLSSLKADARALSLLSLREREREKGELRRDMTCFLMEADFLLRIRQPSQPSQRANIFHCATSGCSIVRYTIQTYISRLCRTVFDDVDDGYYPKRLVQSSRVLFNGAHPLQLFLFFLSLSFSIFRLPIRRFYRIVVFRYFFLVWISSFWGVASRSIIAQDVAPLSSLPFVFL